MCRNFPLLFGRTYNVMGRLPTSVASPVCSIHPVELVIELNEADGQVKLTCVGSDSIGENHQPQYTVPPNVWFCAFPTKDYSIFPDDSVVKEATRDSKSHYSLVGCTCAPAFQAEDFEPGKRSDLVSRFPKYGDLISTLTLPAYRRAHIKSLWYTS